MPPELTEPKVRKSSPNHGGARPGSGRKPKTEQNDAYTVLAKARAKRETYRAHLEELKYKEAAGELVSANESRAAMASLIKNLMLTLDTLTEVVEREANLTREQADSIDRIIDRERRSLHAALLASGPE